jgi:hypothetical protein
MERLFGSSFHAAKFSERETVCDTLICWGGMLTIRCPETGQETTEHVTSH